MELSIYNTLRKEQVVFRPIDNKQIKMYVCGPTVYDCPHLGNARSIVVYDVLFRILKYIYNDNVLYVRNITDIDDKIIERAKQLAISITTLTTKTTADFHQDTNYLNCLPPTFQPKATENLSEMIEIIAKLIANGFAYIAEDKDVYFAVSRAKDYFALSNRNLKHAQIASRIENNLAKSSPEDFVLWKNGANNKCSFPSPWGNGRPGWHIECSAMSHRYLGENFDIHGGGADLIFPHHTNEMAQSLAAFPGSKFANYWIHNGFLTVNGEKMSKSLGNFITVKDFRDKKLPGEAVRLLLLSTHYRKPLDYNDKALQDANKMLNYWYKALEHTNSALSFNLNEDFLLALVDDINLPLAIKKINDLAKLAHSVKANEKSIYANQLLACANFLGLLTLSPQTWFQGHKQLDNEAKKIEQIIDLRKQAKLAKNWQQADLLRAQARDLGVLLIDKADGTTSWQKIVD